MCYMRCLKAVLRSIQMMNNGGFQSWNLFTFASIRQSYNEGGREPMFTFYNSVLFAPLKWRQTAHSLFLSHSLSFSFSRSKVKWGIESTRRWRTGKTLKQPTHGMAKTQIPMSIKWNLLFFKNLEQWFVRRSFFHRDRWNSFNFMCVIWFRPQIPNCMRNGY